MHRAAHVAILLAFMGALAVAVVGLLAPMMGGENRVKVTSVKVSAGLFAGAMSLLAADWLAHRGG